MILVDTNILLDIVNDDRRWRAWSLAKLEAASLLGSAVINDLIYAELSVRYETIEELDETVRRFALTRIPIPSMALFLAGKAFKLCRAIGGTRTGVMPDFFIGAHASIAGIPLLTRDVARYRTYFPSVDLIAPSKDD